ncbi:glycoside hydrolase family 10 protein [Candidatus Margulisiibacteriota bacterium]
MKLVNFLIKKTKICRVLFCIGFFSINAWAQVPEQELIIKTDLPKNTKAKVFIKAEEFPVEYRFMWVTRYQMQTTRDVDLIIERAGKYNFNAIFVQVCALGEAFFHSKINPWGKGINKEFDPLKQLIHEAKKEDIEVHVWLNTAYVWGNRELPKNKEHVVLRHPEWVIKDIKGRSLLEYSAWERTWAKVTGIYLDLGIAEVKQYFTALFLEVVNNYEIDGLHFDYIRYPGPQFGFNQELAEDFQRKYQVDPRALISNKSVALSVFGKERYRELLKAWDKYRQKQVEELIAEIRNKAKGIKPDLKISAAVIADIDQAKERYFQDWEAWLKKGIVDFVAPMSYSIRDDLVEKQIGVAVQMAQNYDRGVVIGLGAWRQDPEDIMRKIQFTRKVRDEMGFKNLLGISLFSYDGIIKKSDYLMSLRKGVFPTKAQIPRFSWQQSARPEPLAEALPTDSVTLQVIEQ